MITLVKEYDKIVHGIFIIFPHISSDGVYPDVKK